MSESPRTLAAKIADGQAYVDQDALTVAEAYLVAVGSIRAQHAYMASAGGSPCICEYCEQAAEEPAA